MPWNTGGHRVAHGVPPVGAATGPAATAPVTDSDRRPAAADRGDRRGGPFGGRPGGGGGGGPGGQLPDFDELIKRPAGDRPQDPGRRRRRRFVGWPGHCAARHRRGRGLAGQRLLPRAARRAGRGAALRRLRPHHAARPELPPALAGRERGTARGHPDQPHRDRLSHRRCRRPDRGGPSAGRDDAGREPDADRRREHHRHQLRGVLADQRRAGLPVQHPQPRHHGQGGGGKLDARGDRPHADPAGADRAARPDRDRRAAADAADPRTSTAPASRSPRCSCRRSIRRTR